MTEQRQARVTRDAFIGVLSHELRTPVTTLYGTASILTRTVRLDDDVRDELIKGMRAEADRLRRLVEDLLVLSRAELGRTEVVPEPVLVQRLIPRSVAAEESRWPTTRFRFELLATAAARDGRRDVPRSGPAQPRRQRGQVQPGR